MSKTDKEAYKEPRIPNIYDPSAGKRKRESSESHIETQLETIYSKPTDKLAKFAAPQ